MNSYSETGTHDYAKRKIAEWLTATDSAINRNGAWVDYPIISEILIDEYFSTADLKRYVPIELYDKYASKEDNLCIMQSIPKKFIKYLPGNLQDCGDWIPNIKFCQDFGINPVAIVDVIVPRKGCVSEIWEITNDIPLTQYKISQIRKFHHCPIYEISEKWIMKQDIKRNPYELIELAMKKAKEY